MSLTNYKEEFDNSYQEVFQKVLIGKKIANLRFEKKLKFGESVERVAFDISNVKVRSTSRGSASTIDSITDTSELLTINLEKEAVFHISDGEVTQAGPLNPGEQIGGKIAHLVATDLDSRILGEVVNADKKFDNGDLTSLLSSGTPIALTATTVPQMVTRMPAKLLRANQVLANLIWVLDATGASDIEQYLMGKSIDLAGFVFKNGYAGPVRNAKLYISENLTGEAVLNIATQPTDGDTITINGITFTFKTTLGTDAGDVLIGASAETANTNLAALINNPDVSTSEGIALSSADQDLINKTYKLTATATATSTTIVGIGSGRLIVSETLTDATDSWGNNFIHSYYGKKGGIDVVVQNLSPVDMRETDDRRGTNVFSSYLAGIKTFSDGSKKFLDVLIEA